MHIIKTDKEKEQMLLSDKSVLTVAYGNSMEPLLSSGETHVLTPVKWEDCDKGDIVFCKVGGRYYTHLVRAKSSATGLLITNNKGRVNGWTKQVFGKVTENISL